ncbi:MAG: hypothetical protein ACRCZ0_11255 [Cetobacterium sp.]
MKLKRINKKTWIAKIGGLEFIGTYEEVNSKALEWYNVALGGSND